MGKNTPEAPDYTAAAQATANSNRSQLNAQTTANRPNQNTPFGNTSWSTNDSFDQAGYDRAMDDWNSQGARLSAADRSSNEYLSLRPTQNDYHSTQYTQNTSLDPELQGALDSQIGLQRGRSDLAGSLLPRAQEEFGKEMDWSGFKEMQDAPDVNQVNPEQLQRGLDTNGLTSVDQSSKYYDKAGDAIFNQWSNRNQPLMDRASNQMDTRLRNQGLKPGDEAYDAAIKDLRNSQNDATTDASLRATMGAGSEASRMFGMDSTSREQQFGERSASGAFANTAADQAFQQNRASEADRFAQQMQQAGFNNTERQQQISEEMQRRGFSLNEINAIISGQQVGMPSMPGFNAAGRGAGTDYSGAAGQQYSASMDAYNAKQGALQGMLGGLTGVAGAAAPYFGF